MKYGIQETTHTHTQTFRRIFQGYYPSLLAFNIGSMVLFSAPGLLGQILSPYMITEVPLTMQYVAGNLVLMMFTIGLSMLVFSPGWFLIDAGIVYSTREHVWGTGRPVEGRTVGGWFNDYIKGYSGFGVAFSYLQILFVYYNNLISGGHTIDIVDIIGWFGLPVYVILTVIPSLILLDLTKEHRILYIRRVAAKMGITNVVEIFFEEK